MDSEFVLINVIPDALFDFQVDVPIRVNEPGIFSVMAGIFFFLSDIETFPDALYMASVGAIPENSTGQTMEFRNEPTILTTSRKAEIASYVFIGLGGTIMLFLMFQLVKHQKDQVVTLTQGKFLLLMLFFGIIAMVGSIFFNPKNDLYCNMLGPMLIVPIHLVYSIILGRLWRINAVISPLLLLTLEKEQTFSTRCVHFLSKMTTCRNRQKLRCKVTDAQLARVILLWASPQILLQILNWTLTPDEAQIIFNEDLTTGSTVCSGMYNTHVVDILSVVLLVVQFLAMWIVATQSQELPSLFNEAAVIFDVTLVSVIILTVATIVVIMTNGPSTSPSVMYIIGVLGTLAMVLNASLKLVLPKLQMVWRGETVVVTKLISDHQREQRKKSSVIIYNENDLPVDPRQHIHSTREEDDDMSQGSSVVLVHATVEESIDALDLAVDQEDFGKNLTQSNHSAVALEPVDEAFDSNNSIAFDLSTVRQNGALPQSAPNSSEFSLHVTTSRKRPTLKAAPHSFHTLTRSKRTIVTGVETTATRKRLFSTDGTEGPSISRMHLLANQGQQLSGLKSMRNGMAAAIGSVRNLGITDIMTGKEQPVETFEIDYHPNVEDKIKISETETPSRRLLLRMIDVQQLLKKVNQALLGGMPVSREEWDQIREASIELGGVFEEDVEFDWEVGKAAPQDEAAGRRRSSDTESTKRQRRLIVEKWK